MGYILQCVCWVSAALFFILLFHWACCDLGKPKCLWKIQEGKIHSKSTSEGSCSTSFPPRCWNDSDKSRFCLLFSSLLSLRKCEAKKNLSVLEHNKCIFTWTVLRWRMVLHSKLTSTKFAKMLWSYQKLGSPSYFYLFVFYLIQAEVAIWLFAHSFRKQQAPTRKRLISLSIPVLLYLVWGWICCKWCFELAACDYMCENCCVSSKYNSPCPFLFFFYLFFKKICATSWL